MKICLGTVQLGMPYGVRGLSIPRTEVQQIFDFCRQNEITQLDTASVYGCAEQIIGETLRGDTTFKIISKFKEQDVTSQHCVEAALEASLRTLQIESTYVYLLHRAADMDNPTVRESLRECRRLGLTQHIGVAVYSPEEAIAAVRSEDLEYIDIPFNILDTRLDQIGFFEQAKERGKTVSARSVFLQGILLMEPKEIPNYLQEVIPYVELLRAEAQSNNVNMLTLLLSFVKQHPGIDSLVFGIDRLENLVQIVDTINDTTMNEYDFTELRRQFTQIPVEVLNPSLWRKK